jgi:luciferase family oxidoreductase group 1
LAITLSVLDQSPIPQGSTTAGALRNSLELARLADSLGYKRYWFAEHHGTPSLACNSPEVMIGPAALATSEIRVGSGGIMLPHYSPLKVAETFSMLNGLAPGRIDLGIGRAPGTSGAVARMLQRDRRQPPPNDFPDQVDELSRYLENLPIEVYLLGSSADSSVWAAERGLPYVFADFIHPCGEHFTAFYRQHFEPSARLQRPHTGVCVWAVCADTGEEAMWLSLSARMSLLHLFRGRPIQVPPPEAAEEFLKCEGAPFDQLPAGRRMITGSPAGVKAQIEAVAEAYGAQEVFIVNTVYDHAARMRSYELMAQAFQMSHPGRSRPLAEAGGS